MTALLTLLATLAVIACAALYERLLSIHTRLSKAEWERDHARWRALVAEDTAHKLRTHLTAIAGSYAERGAENEALRLEIWKRPQPGAQGLRPVRIPTDEQLEAGQW